MFQRRRPESRSIVGEGVLEVDASDEFLVNTAETTTSPEVASSSSSSWNAGRNLSRTAQATDPPESLPRYGARRNVAPASQESLVGNITRRSTLILDDPENEEIALHQDVFTLIFVSDVATVSFFYCIFFFSIQIGILILIMINLLKDAPPGNPLRVPLSTGNDVVAAQALALLVSFITQEDVVTTMDMIRIGYDKNVKDIFGSATRTKWVLSNILRISEGFLSIFVSFVFIVQSIEVLELFLNFAAVQFVSTLDNIGFALAYKGYVGSGLEKVARKVKTIRFCHRTETSIVGTDKVIPSQWLQRGIFLITMAALYVGWAVIRVMQANGHYLGQVCQNFDVFFGDQYYDFFVSQSCNKTTINGCPWKNRTRPLHYGPFSDWYEASRNSRGDFNLENGRPVYYQRGQEDGFGPGSPPGKFSYCNTEDAWVFTVAGVTKGSTDDCDWLMRSAPAKDTYSLHEAPLSGWSIWTGILQDASPFEISCGECNADVDCNYHGSCIQKRCVCEGPWIGNKCQICAACSELTQKVLVDDSLTESVDEKINFIRLDGAEVYGRPVYYKNGTSIGEIGENDWDFEVVPGAIEVMFYAGTRFYITIWHNFLSNSDQGMQESDLERLRSIFINFHSTWHLDDNENRTMAFYTEVTNNPMPIEVEWNVVQQAPLAIFSGEASGFPVRVNGLQFDCAIEAEKTLCSFAASSRAFEMDQNNIFNL